MSHRGTIFIRFFRQRIGARIMAGFGLITLLALLVALVSLLNVWTVNRRLEDEARRERLVIASGLTMSLALERQWAGIRGYVLSGDQRDLQRLQEGQDLFASAVKTLAQESNQPEATARLTRLRALEAEFEAATRRQIVFYDKGWTATPQVATLVTGQEEQKALDREIGAFNEWQQSLIGQEMAAASNRATLAMGVALGLVGLAGLVSTMIALVLTRSITRPIRGLARVAGEMKGGNLAVIVPSMGEDEIGTLAQTIAQMASALDVSRRSLEASLAETEQRNRELTALNTVAAAASSLDRQELLLKAIDVVLDLTGDEAAAIFLREPDGSLLPAAERGMPAALTEPEPLRAIVRFLDEAMLRPGLAVLRLEADTTEPPEMVELIHRHGIRSSVTVPLTSQGTVVGLLSVASTRGRVFDDTETMLLGNIGSQVGIAVENASLVSQLEGRVTTLSVINEVSRAISAVLDLDQLYAVIHEQCLRSLDMPTFTIALWDDEAEALTPALVHLDYQRQDLADGWPTQPALALVVARGRRPLMTNDYYATCLEYGLGHVVPPKPIRRSWMGVPMTIGDRLVGVIVVATPLRRYGDADRDLLLAVANQAAVAVENARLYQRTRELGVIEERNRLAREIHDTIAQGLTGIVLQLEATGTLLDTRPERARQRLSKATELARGTLGEARRSVWNLRPRPLEERSLFEAIEGVARRLEDDGIRIQCELVGEPVKPAPETENSVYRIAQEALENIRKHAAATEVELSLAFDDNRLMLTIGDNGRGFDPEQLTRQRTDGGGFGLLGMRERARLVGGQLEIHSSAGAGTVLIVMAPLALHADIPKPTRPATPTATRALMP